MCHSTLTRGSWWLSISILTVRTMTVGQCLCHKWPGICSVCLNDNPSYRLICNTTGATSRSGSAYSARPHQFTPCFSGVRVSWSLVFCVMFYRSLFVLCLFSFVNVLSVLQRFITSDYPFDFSSFIFALVIKKDKQSNC